MYIFTQISDKQHKQLIHTYPASEQACHKEVVKNLGW